MSSPCFHQHQRDFIQWPRLQGEGLWALFAFSLISHRKYYKPLSDRLIPHSREAEGFYVSQRYVMSFSKQIRRQPGLAALSHYLATAWHAGSSKRCAVTALQLLQSHADGPPQALQCLQSQLHPRRIILRLRENYWKQQLYDFWEVWGSFACIKSRDTDLKEGSVLEGSVLRLWDYR